MRRVMIAAVLVRHLLEMIDDVEVHVLRQEILADPLGDVGIDLVFVEHPGLFVFLEDGPVGGRCPTP